MKVTLYIFLFCFISSCQPGQITVSYGKKNTVTSTDIPKVMGIVVQDNQLIVSGEYLAEVEIVQAEGSIQHDFLIAEKSANQLTLDFQGALNFLVGESFNLIVSNAHGSSTFPVSFELKNGQVTAAKLHHMGATTGQILKFNGTSWAPGSITSNQIYSGTYNANNDTPNIRALSAALGTYYIVTTAGTQNFGSGAINFNLGDWVMFNGTDWERIPVGHNTVSSFNSRQGSVIPLAGDYSWSMLQKASGKLSGSKLEEIENVDVVGIQDGDILKWDSGSGIWVAASDEVGTSITSGSITSNELSDNSVNSNKIVDGSIVNADISASAGIAQSKILNLTSDLAGREALVTPGSSAQYYRGDKTWQTLSTSVVQEGSSLYFTNARAMGALLSGYSVGTAIPLAATDTLLEALGKLEAQTAAISSGGSGNLLIDGSRTMTGDLRLGSNKIIGLANPVAASDAATKSYVDTRLVSVSPWSTSGSDIYFNTGAVGIGTTSPWFALDVQSSDSFQARFLHSSNGQYDGAAIMMTRTRGTLSSPTAVTSGDTIGGVYFRAHDGSSSGTTNAAIEVLAGENHTTSARGSRVIFETVTNGSASRTEKMRIHTNGNIGIGVTAPAQRLDVSGNIRTSGCLYYNGGSTGTCASDERIKTNVTTFSIGLNELLGIEPVNFKYNGLGELPNDGELQLGLIAQKVEKVAPELVVSKQVRLYPEDQNPTEIKGVNYGALTYVLINAVKELHNLFQELFTNHEEIRRELASVKAQNADLTQELQSLRGESLELKNYLCQKDATAAFCKKQGP